MKKSTSTPQKQQKEQQSQSQSHEDEQYYDIIIIGAGISGIGAGYHIQKHCPNKTFTILEGRDTVGGTWDLFKYPGIRSDSSMETMGYSFKPWQGTQSIANGEYILQYMHETIEEFDLKKHIKCNHMLKSMNFNTNTSQWNLNISQNNNINSNRESKRPTRSPLKRTNYNTTNTNTTSNTNTSNTLNMKCSFVLLCTGYYDYESGYSPIFEGMENFRGPIIHPQNWPEDLNYSNKRIAIIGSF